MKKEELPNGVSPEQFKSWKEKWGSLLRIVEAPVSANEGDTKAIVVKSPENDRIVCGQFEKYIDSNPDKAREIMVSNCVLGEESATLVKSNNFAFRAVSQYLIECIPTATVRLKN